MIFTTAYRDYAVEGFELNAIDYLLKPIVFTRFFKAIERFLASRTVSALTTQLEPQSTQAEFLFIRTDRKEVKAVLADILYVKSIKDYIKIHTAGTYYLAKETLSAFHQRLGDSFICVHRSYIVNSYRITAFTKHGIEIGEIEVPVSEGYRESIMKRLGFE